MEQLYSAPIMRANSQKKKIKASTIVILAVLIIYALLILIPFYMVTVTSFVGDSELQASSGFIWWPKQGLKIDAYKILFTEDIYVQNGLLSMPSLFVGFLNTLWTTLLVAFCSLFFSGLAAYSYSKVNFVGKNKIFMIELATMMIPMGCMTVPSYVVYDTIGWTYTFLPIIIPGLLGNASMIFFLRSYFDQISKEFVEAAKIDGMGHFGIYLRIMIPIAMPAFIAQFIFAFVSGYNNFAGPLLYLYGGSPATYTLQIMLNDLGGMYSSAAVVCANTVMALLPMIVLYVILQRFFIEGITVGGVKG
ncbi:MAG: carbohydrate ABC transporter permease [Clostridiales bacterium]|nr:carbohydrate ABC transporter permease [Clostridiales bacterium]